MAQYVATAKKATSVGKSLVCHFTGQDDLNLVIAKGARLEIWEITPEGLQHRLDVPLYGAIATMEAYRLQDESCDRMFVLTERYQFCVLQFDTERQVSRLTSGCVLCSQSSLQHCTGDRSQYPTYSNCCWTSQSRFGTHSDWHTKQAQIAHHQNNETLADAQLVPYFRANSDVYAGIWAQRDNRLLWRHEANLKSPLRRCPRNLLWNLTYWSC